MALAIEDLINQALRRIGYQIPVGFAYEGSRASRVAVELYAQTRDDTMRAHDYPFARRDVSLVPNGQSAPQPWLYEYGYPGDCLRIRQVMPTSYGTYPVFDPKPVLFTDFNDRRISPAPQKAILTNVSPAILVYTGQITDPATFDANYIEALVENLGRRFAAALGAANTVPMEDALAASATDAALGSQANRPPALSAAAPVGGGRRNEQ